MTVTDRPLVGPVEDLDDEYTIVDVDGQKVFVCRLDGEIYAYRNVCPHQFGPLVEGKIDMDEEKIYCPWHGWGFDIRSGHEAYGWCPEKSPPQVETIVRDGNVYLDL
ncbi:MAG: Rieske (2Fe-2S) protein [Salinigranum sp.]